VEDAKKHGYAGGGKVTVRKSNGKVVAKEQKSSPKASKQKAKKK